MSKIYKRVYKNTVLMSTFFLSFFLDHLKRRLCARLKRVYKKFGTNRARGCVNHKQPIGIKLNNKFTYNNLLFYCFIK